MRHGCAIKALGVQVAVLLAWSQPVAAAAKGPALASRDQTAIRKFVTDIFSGYVAGRDAPPWIRAFTPPMRHLIAHNRLLNHGAESEAIGADPICGCQDWQTIRITGLALELRPDGKVLATVRFLNFGPSTRAFIVARTQRGWLLDDVIEREHFGLRDALLRDNWHLVRYGSH